jgi:ribosomal 30S subunit maturation factor RimM
MALDPTATKPPPHYLPLGDLGRTFQLEGALRWHLPTGAIEVGAPAATSLAAQAVAAAGRLFVTGLGDVRVRDLRFPTAGGALLLLEGVRDRTTAQRVVNAEVWLNPSLLPPELADELAAALAAPSEEEALIGLEVRVDGAPIGTVQAAELSGPNDYVVVALHAGGTCLVPLAAPYVALGAQPAIELTDPPAGLLDPS